MESHRIEFTLEEDPLKRYRVTDAGPNRRHKLSLTDTNCVSVKFGGRNISIAVVCNWAARGSLLETFTRVVLYFTAAFRVFEVISQLPYTCVKAFSRGGKRQGISTGEMHRACVELTRALLGQSAQPHSVNLNPHPYQTLRLWPLPDDWWHYYGNKLAELTRNALDYGDVAAGYGCCPPDNCYLYYWSRSMMSYIFYSIRYAYRFFTCQKTEPKTDSLYQCSRLTAYRYTRLL